MANAAAAPVVDPVVPDNPYHAEIRAALTVCGITAATTQDKFIEDDGVASLQALGSLTEKDVSEMIHNATRRSLTAGGYRLGILHVKKIKALNWWVRARLREQEEVDGHGVEWNEAACKEAMVLMDIERTTRERSSTLTAPEKFNPEHFMTGILQFQNYLQSHLGVDGTRLDYVIRDINAVPDDFTTRAEQTMWKAPLHGPYFEIDNSTVWNKLKAWTLETAGWEWIRGLDTVQNGREAWEALTEHYNGSGHISRRVEFAKAKLEKLHWSNEAVFSYDKYTTAMKSCFVELSDPSNPDESYSQRQQVDRLLKGMQNTHAAIESAKTLCFQTHYHDFDAAVNYMSGQVARIFPKTYDSSTKRRRQISEVDTAGRGRGRLGGRSGRGRGGRGRSGGRGSGRGGRGRGSGGTGTMNGVDVSDVARSFTSEEWQQLGDAGRRYVNGERNRSRGSDRNVSGVDAGDASGDANVVQDNSSISTSSNRGAQNGVRFGANGGRGRGRTASAVTTSRVRRVHRVSMDTAQNITTAGVVGRNEMDSHADTCCAGANWTLIGLTGQTCDVSPFTQQYAAVKDVPIGTCATSVTDESGETLILVCHQMLWFGDSLPHSLLNPNQLRHGGTPVRDDPTQEEFGIELSDGNWIPLFTAGTTVFYESRVPTQEELETCRRVEMNYDDEWSPSQVSLQGTRSPEEEEMRWLSSLSASAIQQGVKRYTVCGVSEGERAGYVMKSSVETRLSGSSDPIALSITDALDYRTMTDRLIGAIRVASSDRDTDAVGLGDVTIAGAVLSMDRHAKITPEELSRKWGCGLETAKKTLKVTTQKGIRYAVHPLHRRYRVDHLNLHRKRLGQEWYMDQMFSKVKSLSGNTCANVFTNGKVTKVYPLPSTSSLNLTNSLQDFADDVGIPALIHSDLAASVEGRHTDFQKLVRKLRTRMKYTESGRSNQNHAAEHEIGELKTRWRRRMFKTHCPRRLWDFGLVYEGEILSIMSRGRDGRTGQEEISGQTPDISEWLDFEFYDLVWVLNRTALKMDTTDDERLPARWLGVSHHVGSDLSYWLLLESGKIVSRTSVQHITQADKRDESLKKRIDEFNEKVEERLDDTNFRSDEADVDFYLEDVDVREDDMNTPTVDEYGDMVQEARKDADEFDNDAYDRYLGAELNINRGDGEIRGRVVKRARGSDSEFVGRAHRNPLLDTREYWIEFPDGDQEKYAANVIAENLYSQVDSEGRQYAVMNEIVDHRSDATAITKDNGFVVSRGGNRTAKKTTRGWELCVEWKDGTSDWVKLKELKESNPVELAEYAVANLISEEPAFKWWVPYTLKKRNRIVAKVKSKYWRTTHKFGVRVPKSIDEAYRIDDENGNTYWADALKKEINKVSVAWEVYSGNLTPQEVRDGKASDLIGYQEIGCHMIFDVKMSDLARKCRFVAGGHTTEAPASLTYSSVVSRDSVRIAFLIAAMNNLDVQMCDVTNAYLNAPCREKIWFEGGAECGEDRGKVMLIKRALYGLRSSGAAWRNMLAQTIEEMGFTSTVVDPDVWRRRATKPSGEEYYELLLVFVDDILIMSHEATKHVESLKEVYTLKPESVGPPSMYLGADVSKMQTASGDVCWAMSSDTYVKSAVGIVRDLLKADGEGKDLKTTANAPLPTSYKPETDVSPEVDGDGISRYLQLIGMLRWAIELGRIDIHLEVSMMAPYSASPRVGHLEALYNIFSYLMKHGESAIAFDPMKPDIDESAFQEVDWKDFYGEVEEELPPKMPEPLGRAVTISCFVDANHAGNIVTRRSHSGVLIYLMNSPIIWFSKRQNTVESSSFGSEFVAARIARDLIVSLRIKLRMFGVPIDGPANVFCDNQGVVKNASLPESTLSKKHNAINYHVVREAAAAGILRFGKEDGETNLADLLTKILPVPRRKLLLGSILYRRMKSQ